MADQFVQGKLTASPLLTSGAHAPAKIETVVDSGSRQQIHWNSWKDIILAPLKLLGAICGAPVPPVYSGSTLFKDVSATCKCLLGSWALACLTRFLQCSRLMSGLNKRYTQASNMKQQNLRMFRVLLGLLPVTSSKSQLLYGTHLTRPQLFQLRLVDCQ